LPHPHARYDSTSGGEKEIQRTMLELLTRLDGFDSRGDVKVRHVHALPHSGWLRCLSRAVVSVRMWLLRKPADSR
jgi:hypothetical protein